MMLVYSSSCYKMLTVQGTLLGTGHCHLTMAAKYIKVMYSSCFVNSIKAITGNSDYKSATVPCFHKYTNKI